MKPHSEGESQKTITKQLGKIPGMWATRQSFQEQQLYHLLTPLKPLKKVQVMT
jgi:hypothetical protein